MDEVPLLEFALGLVALIALAGASWLIFQNRAMQSWVAALEAERRDFETRAEGLRRQFSQEQARAGILAEELQDLNYYYFSVQRPQKTISMRENKRVTKLTSGHWADPETLLVSTRHNCQ